LSRFVRFDEALDIIWCHKSKSLVVQTRQIYFSCSLGVGRRSTFACGPCAISHACRSSAFRVFPFLFLREFLSFRTSMHRRSIIIPNSRDRRSPTFRSLSISTFLYDFPGTNNYRLEAFSTPIVSARERSRRVGSILGSRVLGRPLNNDQ